MSEGEHRSARRTDSFVQTDIAGAVNLPSAMEEQEAEGAGGNGAADATIPDANEEEFLSGEFLESTRHEALDQNGEPPDAAADQPPDGDAAPEAADGATAAPEGPAPNPEVEEGTLESSSNLDLNSAEFLDLHGDDSGAEPAPEGSPQAPGEVAAEDATLVDEEPQVDQSAAEPSTAGEPAAEPSVARQSVAERSAPIQLAGDQEIEVSLTAQGDPRFVTMNTPCTRDASSMQQYYSARMSPTAAERQRVCEDTQMIPRRADDCIDMRSQRSPSCESIYHDAISAPPEDTPLMKTTIRLTIMARAKKAPCPQTRNACGSSQVAQRPCENRRPTGDDREGRLAQCAADAILRLMGAMEKKGAVDRSSARMVLSPRGIVVCLKPSGQNPCGQRESQPSNSRECSPESLERPPSTSDDQKLRPCCKQHLARQRPPSRKSVRPASAGNNQKCRPRTCKEQPSRRVTISTAPAECEPLASAEDDDILSSCCPEHPPETNRRPCSRAIGIQTEEIMETVPDEYPQAEICPPLQPGCTCGNNIPQNNQACGGNEQLYPALERFGSVQGAPCPRPQDDFMNPFPCPYYPACLEAAGQTRQVQFCEENNQMHNLTYTIDPAQLAQPNYQGSQSCGEPPDSGYASSRDEFNNAMYTIDPSPIAPPDYQGNQPCGELPGSGYASSRGEINNATYIISREPYTQADVQPNYCSGQPLAPGNTRPYNASSFQPNEQPPGDCGFPSYAGNMNLRSQRQSNNTPFNPQTANQQLQQGFRPNEGMFFSCTGNLNPQNLQLNCQLPSALNFMEGPPTSSMRRNSNRNNEGRMMASSYPSQNSRNSQGQSNMRMAPNGGGSSSQRSREGHCLHKNDSMTPLKQEITRLGQIVDKIVEVAVPLTEYFTQQTREFPALMAPQSSDEIADRPTAELMNRCMEEDIRGNEFGSLQSRSADEIQNSRGQALGVCQERPSTYSGQTEGVLGEMEAVAQGSSRNERTFTLAIQHRSQRMCCNNLNGSRDKMLDNMPFSCPEQPNNGSVGTSRRDNNRMDVPYDMNECAEYSGGMRSQPRYGTNVCDQERSSSSRQIRLCDCPIDPIQERNEGFSGDQRCFGSGSRQQLGSCNSSNEVYSSGRGSGQNMNSPWELGNECNSRGARGLNNRIPENYTKTSSNDCANNNKKPLPVVCEKHRMQASRRGLV